MKKYVAYILIWLWCYFVSIFMTDKLLPNRVLNYVVTILLLVITYALFRRFILYKEKGTDDEDFIAKWEVKRRKGELNYLILNGVIVTIAIVIMIVVYVVTHRVGVAGGDLPYALFVSLFTGFILSLTSWEANDKKYIKLKEKEK